MKAISDKRKTVSIILKAIVFISAMVGTILSAYAGRFSFMGSVWWILVLLLFLVVVGYLYLMIADLFAKKGIVH